MPPLKPVKRLSELSKRVCNKYFVSCAENIAEFYGAYDNAESFYHYSSVQRTLLHSVPSVMVDDLLSSLELNHRLKDREKCILLKIFMHPKMRELRASFSLPAVDDFYLINLPNLNHLVKLDLSMVCTDEILEILGSSCPNLESIRILSKVKTASNNNLGNALRLLLCVSDRGLEHLWLCKKLRSIKMNRLFRSNCGGRRVSHNGIRGLLTHLPRLEYVSFQDIGLVLDLVDPDVRLNLTYVHDYHATPERIAHIEKVCPRLSGLTLFVPQVSPHIGNEYLEQLALSNLKLAAIDFTFFPFDTGMKTFLNIKGHYLRSLSISHSSGSNISSLVLIAECCPNLNMLEICLFEDNEDFDLNKVKNPKYFSKLQHLMLSGESWNPAIVFPLCIYNAKHLKYLFLFNSHYSISVETDLLNLQLHNPLSALQRLQLFMRITYTFDSMDTFIMSCNRLTNFQVRSAEGMTAYIEHFRSTFPNFDIEISISL